MYWYKKSQKWKINTHNLYYSSISYYTQKSKCVNECMIVNTTVVVLVQKKSKVKYKKSVDGASRTSETIFFIARSIKNTRARFITIIVKLGKNGI